MSMKQIWLVAGLGVASLGIGAGVTMLPGQGTPSPDEIEQAELAELAAELKEEDDFLRILPAAPQPENRNLVPHAAPDEAAAIAADFFARPAPSDAELAGMVPFSGTENVPIHRCGPYWSEAATKELDVMTGPPDRRMKDLIYERLNVRRALDTGDCTCVGKVAPFEAVGFALNELKQLHGEQIENLIYPYSDENMRLRRGVQRLCGGDF
jgi:hypothetical protein